MAVLKNRVERPQKRATVPEKVNAQMKQKASWELGHVSEEMLRHKPGMKRLAREITEQGKMFTAKDLQKPEKMRPALRFSYKKWLKQRLRYFSELKKAAKKTKNPFVVELVEEEIRPLNQRLEKMKK